MREAMRALEFSVVIDVAMTETARQADYVLPASSQFEKAEATFFNLEFPRNAFHLRRPLFAPAEGTLPEAEIHARLLEAMGALTARDVAPLRWAARLGRWPFLAAFAVARARNPAVARALPVALYRSLGPTLPAGMAEAAVVWGLCQLFVASYPAAAARAGFGGLAPVAAEKLFRTMLTRPSGVVFAESTHAESLAAVPYPGGRIRLVVPELLAELDKLATSAPPHDPAYPLILAAGERRTDTANTVVRGTGWHRRGRYGTLRVSADDAAAVGAADGDRVRLTTRRGAVEVELEVSDRMRPGHISLANGQGLQVDDGAGVVVRGVAPNELTDHHDRDFLAGTPWHKFVPARLERVADAP
jgi:anaerobic selenocysteine-containing dehydrogenase